MMAKAQLVRLGFVAVGALALGCEVDEPCMENDPELVSKFDVPKRQTQGPDGLCYAVDPEVKNWGAACDSTELCGGGLICPGDDLPICTAVGCNPDPNEDEVCGRGFTCIQTGDVGVPTICIPLPPSPPAPPPAATEDDDTSAGFDVFDGGAGDAGANSRDGGATETNPIEPNIGTECELVADPVCVGGTFCEAQSLRYCTVDNCAAGLANESTCAAVGACASTPPAPASGICIVQ